MRVHNNAGSNVNRIAVYIYSYFVSVMLTVTSLVRIEYVVAIRW